MGRRKKTAADVTTSVPRYRAGAGLNKLRIQAASDPAGVPLMDCSTATTNPERVEVVFDGLEARLVKEIGQHPAVVGCVAWLTSKPILRAMATRECVSFVVQKEDFLRPDSRGNNDALRGLYSDLPRGDRLQADLGLSHISFAVDPGYEAVRCLGNHNSNKKPAWPRMHHKFAVFLDYVHFPQYDDAALSPMAVWTGSYNWSHNASESLENAVLIHDAEIARAYFQEWGQLMALSEPLDWESVWCAPEWRIGS